MQTETLQLTLPTELVERIRARVQSGEFASESDVIIDNLYLCEDDEEDWSDLPNKPFQGPFEDWLQNEIPKRLQELESGTTKTYTLDEVRAHFADKATQRAKAA